MSSNLGDCSNCGQTVCEKCKCHVVNTFYSRTRKEPFYYCDTCMPLFLAGYYNKTLQLKKVDKK